MKKPEEHEWMLLPQTGRDMHRGPKTSINVEEMLDKMIPRILEALDEAWEGGKHVGYQEEAIKCDTHCKEEYKRGYEAGRKDTEQQFSTISGGWKSGYERGALDMQRKCLEAIPKESRVILNKSNPYVEEDRMVIYSANKTAAGIRKIIEAIKPTEV